MKTLITNISRALLVTLLSLATGISSARTYTGPLQDTISRIYIEANLSNESQLLFPLSTKRIYAANGNRALWFASEAAGEQIWNALLMLDCAVQYGLDHHNYHPDYLTVSKLRELALTNDLQGAAKTDVLLTDAMIAFINHLHYGRLNPVYTAGKLDAAEFAGMKAGEILKKSIESNRFIAAISDVQPAVKNYRDLQGFLKLVTGQYTGDSYEPGIETIKTIAVNLERWRWDTPESYTYVLINIPAFRLRYVRGDEHDIFKVIVGKPSTQTPVLSSEIKYFTTAPDWTVPKKMLLRELLPVAMKNPAYFDNNNFRIYDRKGNTLPSDLETLKKMKQNISEYTVKQSPGCDNALGRIAFNFQNSFSVYLHDTPDRSLFNRQERALSHGCIRLEHPEQFAKQVLTSDGAAEGTIDQMNQAMDKFQKKVFTLRKPLPIYLRYFTCEMDNGVLLSYKDVYKKDNEVMSRLFASDFQFIAEIKEFIQKKEAGFPYHRAPVAQK